MNIKELLCEIVGVENVLTSSEDLKKYGHDETEDLVFMPDLVIRPSNTVEVQKIMQIASKFNVPVTPIGGQTGLSGGALCVRGGIALATNRMNKIIKIDKENFQVITQPGVITEELQNVLAENDLFYPVDPSSKGSCFIGGNVSENAGGARAVKYGTTKDYVLNLEVVLPNGNVIWTGANTLKNATGYNLTQLIVGSEGTLGVVTQIVLKVLPPVAYQNLMLVPFRSTTEACQAVAKIFQSGVVPSALEFMERDAIEWTIQFLGETAIDLSDDIMAHLLIEVDGNDPNVLLNEAEKIMDVVNQFSIGEVLFADAVDQKNTLWKLRRSVAEAVKANSIYKEEDTVVPRYRLPELLEGIKKIGAAYGFKSVCYGHAGDGNLHVNIIKGTLTNEFWKTTLPLAIREIFDLTVRLGGTLSGEHGIGWVQKQYLDIAFTEVEIALMRRIKEVFDPEGIMNPGKIL